MFIKQSSTLVVKSSKSGYTFSRLSSSRPRYAKDTRIKTLLSSTKIELILENNIEHKIWYKLLVNLGINSITAIGHQTAKILQLPEMSQLCRNILEEGLKVAQSEGIHFPKQTVDDIMAIYKGYPDEMGTSMYYDVMNQQP